MRNIILTVVAAGSSTFAVLTPALATGVCSEYPNRDGCPIYGVYESPTDQAPYKHIRHARNSHASYRYHG
jgi:hypothetical protein